MKSRISVNQHYDEQIPKHSQQVDDEKYYKQHGLGLQICRKAQQDEFSKIGLVFCSH